MKRSLILGLLFVALLIFLLVIAQKVRVPSSGSRGKTQIEKIKTPIQPSGVGSKIAVSKPSSGQLSVVEMKKAEYTPDYLALARARENLPFEFRGGPGKGRVMDKSNHLVQDSGDEIAIIGAVVGPDKQHVLVKGGSGVNFLLNPSEGLKIKLPTTPPGDQRMFAFDWFWIGNHSLLGVSGSVRLEANGLPVTADDNIERTELYVYDFRVGKLSAVVLPDEIAKPVYSIIETNPGGYVKIAQEVPQTNPDENGQWFKIDLSS